MLVPSMTAEAAIYPRGSQGYALRTASGQRANASIVPAQNSCHVCCGLVANSCCSKQCPEGTQAWCHCNYFFGSRWPRCECI